MRTRTTFTVLALSALTVAGLAGCSSSNDAAEPTATETVTTTAEPTTPATTPTPSESVSATPTKTTPAGGGGTTVSSCTSSNLAASIAEGDGGAAGTIGITLVLTNKGSASCTLQGWPGVSLVGGGTGTQIGAAAKFDRTTPHGTVTLASGSTAKADLRYLQAGNFDRAKCKPTATDGFRVYPPGQKASVFAAYKGVTGCKSTSVQLLTVGALQ
ncbi:uncharacterized protein DUF4232 [Frondihabitans sp. PhB188]|uniref:DUF4232 domain-containing protein n=1 Tax=Frondihabitans sp. PhB188 TaxID=2485200 RepID=UPI000F46D5DA|nr:DUF4232 domain-containing protein [Frondihabitans sp. PhB188]ROQ37164.1 uncharacterized protein DUF4232 [Frondihabitans sp. PhB188]